MAFGLPGVGSRVAGGIGAALSAFGGGLQDRQARLDALAKQAVEQARLQQQMQIQQGQFQQSHDLATQVAASEDMRRKAQDAKDAAVTQRQDATTAVSNVTPFMASPEAQSQVGPATSLRGPSAMPWMGTQGDPTSAGKAASTLGLSTTTLAPKAIGQGLPPALLQMLGQPAPPPDPTPNSGSYWEPKTVLNATDKQQFEAQKSFDVEAGAKQATAKQADMNAARAQMALDQQSGRKSDPSVVARAFGSATPMTPEQMAIVQGSTTPGGPMKQMGVGRQTGSVKDLGLFAPPPPAVAKAATDNPANADTQSVVMATRALMSGNTTLFNAIVAKDPSLQKAAVQKAASFGIDPLSLDTQSKAMSTIAKEVVPQIEKVRQMAEQVNQMGLMGPGGGRLRDFMTGTIGSSDLAPTPEGRQLLGQFKSQVGLLMSAANRAHLGARGAGNVAAMAKMEDLLGAGAKDLPLFLGSLNGVKAWMDEYAKMTTNPLDGVLPAAGAGGAGRVGGPPPAAAPPPPPSGLIPTPPPDQSGTWRWDGHTWVKK